MCVFLVFFLPVDDNLEACEDFFGYYQVTNIKSVALLKMLL